MRRAKKTEIHERTTVNILTPRFPRLLLQPDVLGSTGRPIADELFMQVRNTLSAESRGGGVAAPLHWESPSLSVYPHSHSGRGAPPLKAVSARAQPNMRL